ncbi:hypothetical protein AgCh_017410 [Apium graveolens]
MANKKQISKVQDKSDEEVDKSLEPETEPQDENLDSMEDTKATVTTSETTKKRTMIPIDYPDWSKVPNELKEKIWIDVKETFKVPKQLQKGLIRSAGAKWLNLKANLTRDYVKPYLGQKKKLRKPPVKYAFVGKEAWKNFVAERTTSTWKSLSEKQMERVSNRKYPHRTSRKGYVGLLEEEQKKGTLALDEEPNRALIWHKARKGKLDDEEVDPELAEIGKRIENLLELQSKGEFIPSGSQDVLTTALQTPEHSGRVRGVGGFVSPSIFFNLPNGKRSRITKAELLARDCERDAELEKAKQEMAKKMEKTRQELAELKGLLSKANISSPLVSEKASCDAEIVDDQMDPFPRENKAGPQKCELAVGTIENNVAFGLLFDDDGMNKSIHGLPMHPGCARVSVDGPIQGQAKIPVPVVGEIKTVEQAVGSYVSWPHDLIIFPDAPGTAKSKRKGKDPLTDLHKVQSLFENMEINKNVPKRFWLLYKHATTCMKSTGNSIQIPCDAEVFGVEKRIFILHENIIALLEFKMIGQAAISAYMAYLHCIVCENENLEQFAFCDPGVSFTLNNNFEDNLVSRFNEDDRAVIAFNIQAGRGNKAPTIRYVTGCPKQPGGTECGYVVMWYMKQITMDNEMTFVKKWSKKNRKVTVAKAELDETDPREPYLLAMKRIFKYLKGAADLGLWYPRESDFKLIGYSDADFAGCKLDRKSTSGSCQFLGGRMVSWFSKKQKSISTSTAEAEYIAAGSCCAQILWMKNQLLDYGLEFSKIHIYCDNQSVIAMTGNPIQHSMTKHISIRYHFIREHVDEGTVELHFVPTNQQLADIFTKPLCEATLIRLVNELGMVSVEARVHASKPVIIEAENVTSQKEKAAQSSDTLKRKSVNSDVAEATPSLERRLKKMKARRYLAKAISEDTEEAKEGDQEYLISQEPIIIEALPAQAKDTIPPVSPIKATDDAKEQIDNSEIDIHNLNMPEVLYLEAPSTSKTPALEINSADQNLDDVIPESTVASHTVELSEQNESSSSSDDNVSVETPVPTLDEEELVKKFVEKEAPIPWEDTHRGVEWAKKWNESDFIPCSKLLTEHIAKADELLTNADFKTQLKITALSTKHLQAIEKTQEKQHAQIDEVLANQASQKAQLDEIQSSVKLLLSLLLPDDAKKGEKVVKSKCSPTQELKKKDDKGDDQGNSEKSRGSEDSQKFLQTPKLKGKQTSVYYKDPKIQTLDEEIARRLFLKHNPGMDLETLKEEEARFAAKKTNPKSKASDAKKPPRPKEKGIVIKEKLNSETSKFKTRSQTESDPKEKGKGKIYEPTKPLDLKTSQDLMKPVYKMVQVTDDNLAEDKTVQILKIRKINEDSKTTSDTAQVIIQNKGQEGIEETTNSDQAIKTSTTDNAQVDLGKMTIADKKKLLWKKATPVEPKSNLMINQLATFGLRAKQPRDRAGLGSDEEKIQTGVEVNLRDPFILTNKPYEQIKQRHLDKVLSAQVVIDAHDKENLKEKLILFLNDERTYRLANTDVLKKSIRELQHIYYLLEVKSDVTRRWSEYILKAIRDLFRISGTKTFHYSPMITEGDGREIPMLKNSAKVEVILKGRCLCYNENSSHPKVIRLGDGLERTSIQALRTAIYQIGDSKEEELMQVKAQLAEVLKKAEDNLINDFVKNHYGFRLIQ